MYQKTVHVTIDNSHSIERKTRSSNIRIDDNFRKAFQNGSSEIFVGKPEIKLHSGK